MTHYEFSHKKTIVLGMISKGRKVEKDSVFALFDIEETDEALLELTEKLEGCTPWTTEIEYFKKVA